MRVPAIRGIIDRRILANYHIDPDVLARVLPAPFRPQLINGYAIGGICLIRLKGVRPAFFPLPWGIRSENAAHRFAVAWDADGQTHQGVYIPRRDTDSRLNAWAGGTVFPGIHHHARFTVKESADRFSVTLQSDDGQTRLHVSGKVADHLPASSVFPTLADASEFFEQGSLGYSATSTQGRYDGMELCCDSWHVEALEIDKVQSSYFEDKSIFKAGSVEFDCALLMRHIKHQWQSRDDLCCAEANADAAESQVAPEQAG